MFTILFNSLKAVAVFPSGNDANCYNCSLSKHSWFSTCLQMQKWQKLLHSDPVHMIAALFSVERMQKLSSEMRGKRQREGGGRSGVLVTYRSYMSQVNDRVAADVCAQSHFNTMCINWCNRRRQPTRPFKKLDLMLTFLFRSNILWGLNFTGKTRCWQDLLGVHPNRLHL